MGGGMPNNMANLMRQAQKMQQQMEQGQKDLEAKEFVATAGGGAVTVTASGKKELVSLKLSKDIVDPDDTETLEDTIVAAVNDALKQVSDASNDIMGKMGAGLGGLPF